MVNEDYSPSNDQESILEHLSEGRVTPRHLKDVTDLNDQQINYALNQLMAAGWVRKVSRGLYELVEDPRGKDEVENGGE